MRIQIAFYAILATGLLTVSCKKELQPQESSTDTTAVANSPSPMDPQAPTVQPTAEQRIQPTPTASPTPVPASASAQTAPGMNPPHGQPGHRCDIAVGAPLSSAPAKPASQTPQTITPAPSQTVAQPQAQAPAPTILNTPAQGSATAPGMNPPHGQPGHRCDVSVGAPLPKA